MKKVLLISLIMLIANHPSQAATDSTDSASGAILGDMIFRWLTKQPLPLPGVDQNTAHNPFNQNMDNPWAVLLQKPNSPIPANNRKH